VIEAHFGASPPLSLGVEEELMILDEETLAPVAAVEVLLRGAASLELPGSLKTELHASVVELNTGVCANVAEAIAALRELRAAADAIARANGLVVAAAGAHPTVPLESLPVVQEPRYLEMLEQVGYPARRQGVNGLHVHVGVESAEHCHERARGGALLAAGRARAVGQLSVRGRRRQRDAVEPRRRARGAAARRPAAGLRVVRGVGGPGSSGSCRSA